MNQRRMYVGHRGPAGCAVRVATNDGVDTLHGRTREPLWSFGWGRPGRSTIELAWALLYDVTADRKLAGDCCLDFSTQVVARLPRDSFSLEAADVERWLEHGM